MIRKESFALSREDFAASRRPVLEKADERLEQPVRGALMRLGLPRWEDQAVQAALDIFDESARAEIDQWNPIIDDMRDEFARELGEALKKTKPAEDKELQVRTIVRWLSTMAINAGTEAATTSDPDEMVGLEWVTMHDSDVRSTHREADGETVPSGQPFSVGGEELLYPGQPVGDPSIWINCRCMARPAVLEGFTTRTITASGEAPGVLKDGSAPTCNYCSEQATKYVLHSEGMAYLPACGEHLEQAKADAAASTPDGTVDEGNIDRVGDYSLTASAEEEWATATVMALPAQDDWVSGVANVPGGAHCTLLFLGEATFDPEPIKAILQQVADGVGSAVTDGISGSGTLGSDDAQVLLLDAQNLANIRGAILGEDDVRAVHDGVEQFPAWIPHVSLSYGTDQPLSEDRQDAIRFDRIALWYGEDRSAIYYLGGNNVAEEDKPEDAIVAAAAPDDTVNQVDEEAPQIPDEEAMEEVPWHGVLAPEGTPSGDGRQFGDLALSHRDLPLPLKTMFVDDEGHKGSVICGRIDRIFREGGLVKGEGVFDTSPAAYESIRLIANGMWRGVSVDVDAAEASEESSADLLEFSSARIASATLCAIPAFAEAYVALGTWADQTDERPSVSRETSEMSSAEEFAPVPTKTKDGPGWITDPEPTKRITDYWVDGVGAAKIGWGAPGDFNRCRVQLAKYVQNPEWLAGLCANLHYRALRAWPGQASVETEAMEAQSITAAALTYVSDTPTLSADLFRNPNLEGPTPFTVTEDGHVFGHIATWDTCHIGLPVEELENGEVVCTTAPHSMTSYAYFLTGEVLTDAGPVPVGQVTIGGGHADGKLGLRAAASHYDSTSAAIADITVGEDEFGIWAAGATREGVSEKDVRALRAAALSGDWRRVVVGGRGNLELIAALAVNVPGFPIPRASLAASGVGQLSLVAAAIPVQGKSLIEDAERLDKVSAARASIRKARAVAAKRKLGI